MAKNAVESFRERVAPFCKGKQEIVATKAGISRMHLYRILKGKTSPSLEIAENIANAIGVRLSEIVTSDSI